MIHHTVNAYADVGGASGMSVAGRDFFTALNKLTDVCLIPKYPDNFKFEEDHPVTTMIRRLETIDLHATSICLDFADSMHRFGGGRRIGFTFFEVEKLAPAAVHQLKQLDQVWVPTRWARDVLKANCIAEDRIRIVHAGVDTQIFKPGGDTFPELVARQGFRFLTVGKWEARKGLKELIRTFDETFGENDAAWLVCYLQTNVAALSDINLQQEIDAMKLRRRNRLLLIRSAILTTQGMAKLYNSCDAYVSASRAEGWCLPLMEAMACGLPAIAPFHSGPTEYLTKKNSYPLEVKETEDVYCPTFFPNKGAHGRWARIDTQKLSERMRFVFANQKKAKAVGRAAAADVASHWTWDHAAADAMQWLKA